MILKEILTLIDDLEETWSNEKEFSDIYQRAVDCPDDQLTAEIDDL